MITHLTTASHAYTHRELSRAGRLDFRSLSYTRAFRASSLPRATYIFSDMDRLGFWELELASRLYRVLKAAGLRVLNDPGRVRQRLSLLRELKQKGINRFDAWQADESSRSARYPVFLRTQSAHRGNLTDLLNDESQVRAAIEAALAQGIPMRELTIIEYCAQPIAEKLFRKLSTFRVGNRMVSTLCVHEGHWSAKHGELGIASKENYDDEYAIIAENRWGEPLRPAFEVANVEYGRSDFALVDGCAQVYEINSNPMLGMVKTHPFPIRVRASTLFYDRLFEAFSEIDSEAGGSAIKLDDETLVRQRKSDRWVIRGRWHP
jgi:hypothetical protein